MDGKTEITAAEIKPTDTTMKAADDRLRAMDGKTNTTAAEVKPADYTSGSLGGWRIPADTRYIAV